MPQNQKPREYSVDTMAHSGRLGRSSNRHTAWSNRITPPNGRCIKVIEKSAYDKAIEALKVVNQMLARYEECAESDSCLKKGMSLGVYSVIKREVEVLKELGELA